MGRESRIISEKIGYVQDMIVYYGSGKAERYNSWHFYLKRAEISRLYSEGWRGKRRTASGNEREM